MRKFYLLLIVALLATSSAFADITYELNGGQPNPYGWNTKEDMYNAFMTDAGVTGHNTIEYYQSIDKGTEAEDGLHNKDVGLCNLLKPEKAAAAFAKTEKWGWLETYIKSVYSSANVTSYSQHYGAGAFFICGQSQKYPKSPSFKEAGKDENYLPAWEYCYAFPTSVTEPTTLKNPYHKGAYEFGGWYDNAEFTGEPVTTINADFAGTLYAKWNSIIKYELNGGSYVINNPYGWKSKDDMFNEFLTDGGNNKSTKTLADIKRELTDPFKDAGGLCTANYLHGDEDIQILDTNTEKWGWLKTYIMTFQNNNINLTEKAATKLGEKVSGSAWKYAIAAFFLEKQYTGWPASADFTEAGKDEAYCKEWKHSYEQLINPKFPEADFTLYAAEKEGCTFQGWYDNRWFTGEAVTTVDATTKGSTLYAHWSSIMGSENTTLNTLHTHYFDGKYVYASTIENKGSNKSLYNSDKADEYFSDNAANFAQEDWVAIEDLDDEYVNKELTVRTPFKKVANTDFPVIRFTAAADPQPASVRKLNNYRVANFNIYADNAHVNNIWLVAPQAGEYCHLTGYVKAVSGDVVTLASSDKEDDAVEMTVNIAKLSAKSPVVAGAWYKFTGIVVNGDKALKFNATAFEDVTTGVEASEIGNTIVRGMNGEIAVSVAAPATVSVYTAGGALVATRNIADSDAIAVAPGFYIVKADNTVVKVLVK